MAGVRCRTEQAHAPGDVVDQLPPCDLIVCRDALQSLPVPDIKKALETFSRSEAKYLLCSIQLRRFGWRNGREMRVGRCRDRNLLLDPFNLADPIAIYSEQGCGTQAPWPVEDSVDLCRRPLISSADRNLRRQVRRLSERSSSLKRSGSTGFVK